MKLDKNPYIFIQENAFENVVYEIAAILSLPPCVKVNVVTWDNNMDCGSASGFTLEIVMTCVTQHTSLSIMLFYRDNLSADPVLHYGLLQQNHLWISWAKTLTEIWSYNRMPSNWYISKIKDYIKILRFKNFIQMWYFWQTLAHLDCLILGQG